MVIININRFLLLLSATILLIDKVRVNGSLDSSISIAGLNDVESSSVEDKTDDNARNPVVGITTRDSSIDGGAESSGMQSSIIVDSSGKDSSKEINSENIGNSESSVGDGSSEAAPEGESLIIGDSSLERSEIKIKDLRDHGKARESIESEKESIQYGYDNIDDSIENIIMSGMVGKDDFSSPAIMEPFEDGSPGSVIQANEKQEDSDSNLFEAPTEGADSSFVKTPVTDKVKSDSVETPVTEEVEKNKEKPSVVKSLGKIEDNYSNVEDSLEKEGSEMPKEPDNSSGTDVVFEEASQSKLPAFAETSNEGEIKNMISNPNMFESSITSGISESIESSPVQEDSETSDLIQIKGSPVSSQGNIETEMSTQLNDIESQSSSNILDITEGEPYNSIDKSSASFPSDNEPVESEAMVGDTESTFVNPYTEEITLTEDPLVNSLNGKELLSENVGYYHSNNTLFDSSKTIEPPVPDSDFIEDKTVGNNMFYSGPYIRTNATSGKVSPRIASVIQTLIGQFEKHNLYGSGDKHNENIIGSNVKNIRDSFEGLNAESGDNEATKPKNAAEEEYIASLKNTSPNNTFLYKNRYEEMKQTTNTLGKSLLQEELEKMRGTFRENISKQLGIGKVWERPINKVEQPETFMSYSSKPLTNHVGSSSANINDDNATAKISTQSTPLTPQKGDVGLPSISEFSPMESDVKSFDSLNDANEGTFERNIHEEKSINKTQVAVPVTEGSIETTDSTVSMPGTIYNVSIGMDKDESGIGIELVNYTIDQYELDDSKPHKNIINEGSGFAGVPFSYINSVNIKQQGWDSNNNDENVPRNNISGFISQDIKGSLGHRKLQMVDQENQHLNDQKKEDNKNNDIVLSSQQEKEINQCYSRAMKIKTINFGLEILSDSQSPSFEAFIIEINKSKRKIRELVMFGQEAIRVAEKYSKKRSWRSKTRKFKLEFLELCNNFLNHSKAVRSLIYHISNASNKNTMDIINKILEKNKQSKQDMLIQCSILDQAFYSHKNSLRRRIMKRISNMYFLEVINDQVDILISEKFNPLVDSIKSNKYVKKRLLKILPSIYPSMKSSKGYPELSQYEAESLNLKKKKGNRLVRLFKRIFMKPLRLKCKRNSRCFKKKHLQRKKS